MNSKYSGPKANLLVLGNNWISCLLPSTLITQADALLQNHRLEDAANLAEQQLKKLQSRVNVDPEEVCLPLPPSHTTHSRDFATTQADELRYIYQRLGFQCLTETLFDDAGTPIVMGPGW